MTLPFAPTCLPLLLGGLPHRSAAQAIEISRRYAGALLAWPQLPRRGFREQGFVQSAIGFPGLVIDAPRARVYVACLRNFEATANELALQHRRVVLIGAVRMKSRRALIRKAKAIVIPEHLPRGTD